MLGMYIHVCKCIPFADACCFLSVLFNTNSIGGIIVSMLTSSAVDRWFEPRSGQFKDYKIGICCFSTKHAALR